MQVTLAQPVSPLDFIEIGIFIQGFSERLEKNTEVVCSHLHNFNRRLEASAKKSSKDFCNHFAKCTAD